MDDKRKRWDAVLDRIPADRPTVGVEVGVWRAILSRVLLAERPALTLYLVDPWRAGEPGTPWYESGSVCPMRNQRQFDEAYKRTLRVTKPWADRRRIRRAPSVEVAGAIMRNSDPGAARLDFVFIDGDHSFDGCRADILAWQGLVRPGGWIGGHDWEKLERGRVTEAVLSVYPRESVELDAESTWFVRA
jgi:hypothetical protein